VGFSGPGRALTHTQNQGGVTCSVKGEKFDVVSSHLIFSISKLR